MGLGAAGRCHDQAVGPAGQLGHVREVVEIDVIALLAVAVGDLGIEGSGAAGDLLADIAHADDAYPLARQLRLQGDGLAPAAVAGVAVQHRDVAQDGQQQPQRMVGHAVLVGTGTGGDLDAMRLGVGGIDVFKAGAQGTHQLQMRQGAHFIGSQAGGAVGQHHRHLFGRAGDHRVTALAIRRVEDVVVGGDGGSAFFGKVNQDEQRRFHEGDLAGRGKGRREGKCNQRHSIAKQQSEQPATHQPLPSACEFHAISVHQCEEARCTNRWIGLL